MNKQQGNSQGLFQEGEGTGVSIQQGNIQIFIQVVKNS
jgi:hypothetical protein